MWTNPEYIDPKTPFKDLGADSLDNVELIIALEEAFHIKIPDKIAKRLPHMCVQDVWDYLESRGIQPKHAPREF